MAKKVRDIVRSMHDDAQLERPSFIGIEADGIKVMDGDTQVAYVKFNQTVLLNGRVVLENYRGNRDTVRVFPVIFRCKCGSRLTLAESRAVGKCLRCRTSGTSSRR
jgi:hypothetical protein